MDGIVEAMNIMIARNEKSINFRPRLVIAYADSLYAALNGRHFRRLGWEVHLTTSGAEARRLTRLLLPQMVVLDTDLHEESGWLTCAKLRLENPQVPVLLVTGEVTDGAEAFAQYVEATGIVSRDTDLSDLLEHVQAEADSSFSCSA